MYNSRIREVFVDDAMYQFHQAPWSGVGVGNYEQITASLSRVDTHDPHNVFVLALVEGGYPLGVAFALLCVGTLIWLLRRRKTTLVALALVVQISTLAHAYVDVYWVRGTPVVGWMLIGAAAASTYSWQRSRRDGGGASATVRTGRTERLAGSVDRPPARLQSTSILADLQDVAVEEIGRTRHVRSNVIRCSAAPAPSVIVPAMVVPSICRRLFAPSAT
ncbi:hypothetical protein GS966_28365 [Rhodococcus hoagii]|nr:hypothetical protein [Prescottella equi]